tara:strand:+ start:1340 stop:2296 length:957 start_codon:yes stop_codon:yes gene_type:complete
MIYALKDDFIFLYKKDRNTKKLFNRIGFLNFFKYTASNSKYKNQIKINFLENKETGSEEKILINTNYFKYFYDKKEIKKDQLIMPYYMYPRIYNSYYRKIYSKKKPNFNLRIFFSGSVFNDVYNNFYWHKDPKKFPNRIKVVNNIIKEFKSEIFFIKSKKDINSNLISKKKIIFCLHDKMIKKTSYILDFKNNFKFLGNSCFNLSCPGAVMPLCHHLIEGIKVGSIPITNCEELLLPNLSSNMTLNYSNMDQLNDQINKALNMEEDEIIYMRENVLKYYDQYLSPRSFRLKFINNLNLKNQEIICCDDHRSVEKMNNN